jgi:heavy metal translocating P-type ATPase
MDSSATTTSRATAPSSAVEWRVAHSTPGRLRLRATDRHAPACLASSKAQLDGIPGLRAIELRPRTGSLVIEYNPTSCTEGALLAALSSPRSLEERPGKLAPRRAPGPDGTTGLRDRSLLNLATAGAAFASSLLPVPAGVTAALVLLSGLPILGRASRTLREGPRLNVDMLDAMTFAVLLVRRNYPAASLLAGLPALGQWILERAVVRSRRSLHDLFAPPDQVVRRLRDRRQERIAATAIVRGDTVILGTGERIPIDGHVIRGEALVDQHTMTGEGLPVERKARHEVYAGTIVEDGEIAIRVDRVGRDTGLGHIIEVIERAAGEKAEVQIFAERLANRLVGQTILFGLAGAAFSRSIDAGVAIVVADYGTATRVAIPAAALAKAHQAITEGILLKGPRVLEHLAQIDTVVFDKTGTLTWGRPEVSRIASYGARGTDEILGLAAAAERGVRHPFARTIVRRAEQSGRAIPECAGPETRIGLGVAVTVEGDKVLVGNRRFLESQGIRLAPAAADEAEAHARGASVTFVAVGARLVGAIVLEDELRADAGGAIHALRAGDARDIVMVSGDHAEPTRFVARQLGIERYHADLLPEDKAALIHELRAQGRAVAMVGDGVNDALALRAANVGIAVQGGAEVVTAAAGVVLLQGGLEQVARALDLGRATIDAYRQTINLAVYGNLVVGGLASMGLAGPAAAILMSHGTALGAALLALLSPGGRVENT